MDKLKFETPDMEAGNIEKIRHFFVTNGIVQQ